MLCVLVCVIFILFYFFLIVYCLFAALWRIKILCISNDISTHLFVSLIFEFLSRLDENN